MGKTDKQTPKDIARMIRVDHAGEHGAVHIYRGQLAVFDRLADKRDTAELIRHMQQQEQEHLETFDRLINERRIRPTALAPAWEAAGFLLGATTALMGEKAAMACTAAVEEVIDDHYAEQIDSLTATGEEKELVKTITKFRADEADHRDTALNHGAEQTPGYQLMRNVIRTGCQIAIKVSEKI